MRVREPISMDTFEGINFKMSDLIRIVVNNTSIQRGKYQWLLSETLKIRVPKTNSENIHNN